MTTAVLSSAERPVVAARAATESADATLIRDAARLTRDLHVPIRAIYWVDLAGSAALGYAALLLATAGLPLLAAWAAGLVAILALYRAGSFIHELTHLKPSAVPGFRAGWNLLVGVPLLVPAFMYEGVHNLHHARTRYGTVDDPEYLPLALMRPWTLMLFLGTSAFAPVVLLLRFAIVAPLSLAVPKLRRAVIERYSALTINPAFRRKPPEGLVRRDWLIWESATSLWSIALLAMVIGGVMSLTTFVILLAVASGIAVLNQVRTLVAHLWENDGDTISVTAQYLDTVNVPPPGLLPALWAPVGLRYHALHHLLPGLPYHSLGEAHRRLSRTLPEDSAYHAASHAGLTELVVRLVDSSMQGGQGILRPAGAIDTIACGISK